MTLVMAERTAATMTTSSSCFWRSLVLEELARVNMVVEDKMELRNKTANDFYVPGMGSANHMHA